jgi:hypothetical protein
MAVIPELAPAPALGAPRWRRFLTPWRSPADQPAWARPALLAIAALVLPQVVEGVLTILVLYRAAGREGTSAARSW